MPTFSPHRALDETAVAVTVGRLAAGAPGQAGLGLEYELFPLIASRDPRADRSLPRRAPLAATLARLADGRGPDVTRAEDGWWWADGDTARLTFEPGAQLELSTAYRSTPSAALAALDATLPDLAGRLAGAGIRLAAAGIDVWAPGTVPQQRTSDRYPAMEAYFRRRSAAGPTMMRDTCSLQLNLDLDAGAEAVARWRVANLLAPVAAATFACSPGPSGHRRARRTEVWQRLDATRTGFVAHEGRLTDALTRYLMDADVLLVTDERGTRPGRPGWRFGDWVRDGDREVGWPTADDLDRHLTTLFPEVRPRGWLEIRSIDAVPPAWVAAVVACYVGAVYEPRARERIRELLDGRVATLRGRLVDAGRPGRLADPGLRGQLADAALRGVADPQWCALAVEVWSYALEGAARLPADQVPRWAVRRAETFLDRFTLRGRCPADDLHDQRRRDSWAALTWAAVDADADREVNR